MPIKKNFYLKIYIFVRYLVLTCIVLHSVALSCCQCCGAGAGWSRDILVGAGVKVRLHRSDRTVDKTEEILNDVLFVCSNIDLRLGTGTGN